MSLSTNKCKEVKEIAFKVAEKRFKEGRGSGSGREYRPFLTVRDISSKGRSHRLPSITVGRVHHLLSDLELHVFYLLDWNSDVIDIREQFPIALSSSLSIAEQMGIAHPSVKGIDQVVTTDFIVDLQMQGRTIRKAISVKYADELDNPRTIEKLELERRYWEEKHIPFCIVTELEIPKLFVKNIQWFQPYLTAHSFKPDEQVEYFELFRSSFARHGSIKVTAITAKLDDDYNLVDGFHLSVLRYLLAQRAFGFNFQEISIKNLRGMDLVPSDNWLEEVYEYVVGE